MADDFKLEQVARRLDAPVGLRRKYQPGEIHPITCEHCAARMNGHAGYYALCPSCGNANLLSQYEQPNTNIREQNRHNTNVGGPSDKARDE